MTVGINTDSSVLAGDQGVQTWNLLLPRINAYTLELLVSIYSIKMIAGDREKKQRSLANQSATGLPQLTANGAALHGPAGTARV